MNGLPYIYALTYKGIISYIGLHNGRDKYYFSSGVILQGEVPINIMMNL